MRLFVFAAVILALGISGLAQVATSRLEGTVQDPTGSVVPGAKVEATNVKTQIRASTTTDAEGRYIFPSLRPSEYLVEVEAAGFRKAVRQGVILNVGDTVTEVIQLEVGSQAESVVVEANAVRVQTADGQIGRAVTIRDIDVLPQLGRGPINLAVFNPGVQIDPGDNSYSRVNGARQGGNNTTLDGIEVNDPVVPRLGLTMTPNTTDTVEEFRMITSGGKAEYGRNAGGQIQMITRSGTNSFHGGAWDYLRNTQLNANTFFSNQSGQTRPKFIQNMFGGAFSGPVFKDKTFFFGSYEGRRTRQEVVRNRTVLSPELKGGLFRWTTSSGTVQSYDIFANDPRHIGVDPAVKANLALLPNPNNYDIGDNLNRAGFRFNAPSNSYNDQYTIKVDHQLWNSNRTFFRWAWMRTSSIDSINGAERTFPGQPDGVQGGHRNGWSVGSDWTINATTVNEFRLGGQMNNADFLRPGRVKGPMLISNTFIDPLNASDAQGRNTPFKEITDSVSKIHGKHTFKFGGDVRLTTTNGWRDDLIFPNAYFSITYGPVPSTVGPAGLSSTNRQWFDQHYNELLGRMGYSRVRYYSDLAQFQPAGTSRARSHKFNDYGFFVQDDWRVRPNFTLNAGVRYEYFGVPHEVNGLQGSLNKVDQMNRVNRFTDLAVVKGMPFYNKEFNNFAPRLGFAWDVKGDGKTAIRGSWGVFYDHTMTATYNTVDLTIPGFMQDVIKYPNSAVTSDLRYTADGLPAMPMPAAPILSPALTRTSGVNVMDPNIRTGYMMQVDLTFSKEIFRNTVVEAGYVGTRGIKLFMQENVNQPRIYEDFLGAFKELQAYRANGTPVSANNPLVKIYGSVSAANSGLASYLTQGTPVAAADSIDLSRYSSYAKAGLPDTWLRNYPQFNQVYLSTNSGRSYYNSFQLSFRRQAGALRFNANYTFSKSVDNWALEGNGTSAGSVMDWNNLALNRGRSDFDRPHTFNATFMYTLPVGQGHWLLGSIPRWADSLIGGWELGVLNIWQSGSVFSLSSGRTTGPNPGTNTWINYTGDRNIGSLDRRTDGIYYFPDSVRTAMTGADMYPAAGQVGLSGRNTFRGPRFFNADCSLLKRFRTSESTGFTFRAEAYNMFNNANFANPGATITTPSSFGRISATIGTARTMQMALRYDF